jgi:hypothetical protein
MASITVLVKSPLRRRDTLPLLDPHRLAIPFPPWTDAVVAIPTPTLHVKLSLILPPATSIPSPHRVSVASPIVSSDADYRVFGFGDIATFQEHYIQAYAAVDLKTFNCERMRKTGWIRACSLDFCVKMKTTWWLSNIEWLRLVSSDKSNRKFVC